MDICIQQNELLLREASLASKNLGIGLTELRKYSFANKGSFFHSMVSITTGMERLLKLIVIYTYRIDNNGSFPSNRILKNQYGHKINNLISSVRSFEETKKYGVDWSTIDEGISLRIISLLADYANFARYYNLDYLTGKEQETGEPLARWEREIGEEILRLHPIRSRYKEDKFGELCTLLDQTVIFQHTDTGGQKIDDAESYLRSSESALVKQKYSMFYMYRIIRVIANALGTIESEGGFYPFLSEFFILFRCPDDSYVKTKKRWTE